MIRVVGRTDRRANALSIVVPVTKPLEMRLWLNWLSWSTERSRLETIDRLRFIYAIRWTVLPPFPALEPGRPADPRPHLLFESNFDGDWAEYLEVFGAVQGFQLGEIVRRTEAFPGLRDLDLFKRWAKSYDHLPEHYSSAYPDLTAIDIRQHLARKHGRASRSKVWREGFGLRRPTWTTIRLPLQTGQSTKAVEYARAFDVKIDGRWVSELLRDEDEVHFVRIVVLDRPEGSWLLITLVHDGPIEPILHRMVGVDTKMGTPALRKLLALVARPGDGSVLRPDQPAGPVDAQLLLRHVLAPNLGHLAYCAYPGTSVTELRAMEADRAEHATHWPIPEEDT